jgi:pyruvate dehydrogenase E2 component (dihydrolipoamide acetyltransferase)
LANPTKNHIQLTKIQKLVSQRMLNSKRTKPCFYIQSTVDVTELMELRPRLRKSLGVKITTNAFYIRALALAAGDYPLMVGRLAGGNIKIADRINVGFAVSAPHGLIVPVIKDADKKPLAEIARAEKALTEKARANRLTLDEIEAETIALSNLGVYGIDYFFGIVPPPAATILAVGNVIRRAVPKNGKAVIRKTNTLTLAVDKRIINETYAAKFSNRITEFLQNPQQLIA